jgi:hypothetical protein
MSILRSYKYILGIIFAIFILFFFSFWSVYYERNYIEKFTQISKHIILLGDSMLNNKKYVKNGKSIYDLLEKNCKKDTIFNYAVDGAFITDVYQQINKIPIDDNNSNTFIFLSIGGNNFIDTTENIDSIFEDYQNLVNSIQTKMNESNIILLNLYYPNNKEYHSYHERIKNWNTKLYKFVNEKKLKILKVNNFLNEPEDFTSNIEPSEIGGEKIAQNIKYFTL